MALEQKHFNERCVIGLPSSNEVNCLYSLYDSHSLSLLLIQILSLFHIGNECESRLLSQKISISTVGTDFFTYLFFKRLHAVRSFVTLLSLWFS